MYSDCVCLCPPQLEFANERHELLSASHAAQKKELHALRGKSQQFSSSVTELQLRLSTSTQELLTARSQLSRAELLAQRLQGERDLLAENERRARTQYETLVREQKGQGELLTNLQSIQNNLERSEFETKTRLGAQIESLERELALSKEKLRSEEEKRGKVSEAYETQVRDLEAQLQTVRTARQSAEDGLQKSTEWIDSLMKELSDTKSQLEESNTELQASTGYMHVYSCMHTLC